MSDERERSSPIDLETLLPWSLNGSLTELERSRIRRALEQGHLSQQGLEECVWAWNVANQRPDSATLAALAAGELGPEEAEAVERYLWRPEASEDRELVALGRAAMVAETDPTNQVADAEPIHGPRSAQDGPGLWRAWAVAASLLAVLMASAWWTSTRESSRRGPGLSVVEVVELLPDDLNLRGGESEAVAVQVGAAGASLVLIVDRPVEGPLTVAVRDDADSEIARIEALAVREDGSVQLFVAAHVARSMHRVVLTRQGSGGAAIVVHEYTVRPIP